MSLASITTKIPLKFNPVTCTIRPLNRSTDLVDPDWRHQSPKSYDETGGDDFNISAQPFWRRREEEDKAFSGDEDHIFFRLIARKYDIDQLASQPAKGDLVVSVAGDSGRYKIKEVRYRGHLGGQPRLIWYELEIDPYTRKSM
jgi:hypothetical protein